MQKPFTGPKAAKPRDYWSCILQHPSAPPAPPVRVSWFTLDRGLCRACCHSLFFTSSDIIPFLCTLRHDQNSKAARLQVTSICACLSQSLETSMGYCNTCLKAFVVSKSNYRFTTQFDKCAYSCGYSWWMVSFTFLWVNEPLKCFWTHYSLT